MKNRFADERKLAAGILGSARGGKKARAARRNGRKSKGRPVAKKKNKKQPC